MVETQITRSNGTRPRARPRLRFEAVVVGCSAGGVRALSQLVPALPAGMPAAVLVAQHLYPSSPGLLASLLGRRAQLPVEAAANGAAVQAGVVYVTPPGFDATVAADRTLSLRRADRRHVVPSVDLLFESAAGVYGERLIAVVLTGSGTDGARGAERVKRLGGLVISQDPETSAFASMPRAAIASGAADVVLPLAQIAPTLVALAAGGRSTPAPAADRRVGD